ncbi:MAG: glucose-6-phosphate isomerase, partial [Erysipelotrichaceae bacterium]|nr:glucose-6-phosphate isomerase [Erysipelotrichaceae bacterium]
MIKCDLTYAKLDVSVEDFQEKVSFYHRALHEKTGKGNDFLGWVDWPKNYDKEEFARVQAAAERIRKDAEVFLVCGIGGSYLGARAAVEFVQGLFGKKDVEVLYVGNTFSSTAIVQLLEYIKGKSVYCNVISKSGTTTETALAFRMIRQYMESVYGTEESAKRIFATTDKKRGTLKALADKAGFETFTIPDDIGGRYSVLTSVGLLPIAVAGIDIEAVMAGAKSAMLTLNDESLKTNAAYQYAVARRIL